MQYGGDFRTSNLLFHKFVKQNSYFHKKLAVHLMFETNDSQLDLTRFLDKEVVWLYLLKNNNLLLMRMWISEQIGEKQKSSQENPNSDQQRLESELRDELDQGPSNREIVKDPNSIEVFEKYIRGLFRKWNFNRSMIEQLSRFEAAEKESILNGLAMLGFFITKEEKSLCKHLQRIFVSQTIDENKDKVNKEDLTHFVLENKLVDLLMEKDIIDSEVLKSVSRICNNNVNAEIEVSMFVNQLMESQTAPEDLVEISKKTTNYLALQDPNLDNKHAEIKLFEDLVSTENFNQNLIQKSGVRPSFKRIEWSQNLFDTLKKYNGVDMSSILNDAKKCEPESDQSSTIPHFDHPYLSKKYGASFEIDYSDYLLNFKTSTLALYKFLTQSNIVKDELSCRRAAARTAQMTVNNREDTDLIPHSIAFMEMMGVDSSKFRNNLRYLKIKNDINRSSDFNHETVRDIEAEFVYDTFNCTPTYMRALAKQNRWREFLLIADYLQVSRERLLDMIKGQFENEQIETNLIRALAFEDVKDDVSM